MSKILWHYTVAGYLPAIAGYGLLLGSNAGAPDERPMLWFSANQKWEPTATKGVLTPTGKYRQLTFDELVDSTGCIRFGLPADDTRLMDWKSACAFAGTPRRLREAMERIGTRDGAQPSHWFGTGEAIPLEQLRLQAWADGWRDADAGVL